MSRAAREKRHRAAKRRAVEQAEAAERQRREAQPVLVRTAGDAAVAVSERAASVASRVRDGAERVPTVLVAVVVGATCGALASFATHVFWASVAAGAVGGVTLLVRDRLAPKLGTWTATMAVGLVWGAALAAGVAASGLHDTQTLAIAAAGGMAVPFVYHLLSRPVLWARPAMSGIARAAAAARRRVRGFRRDSRHLYDRPLSRDLLVWLLAAAVAGAAAMQWAWSPPTWVTSAVVGLPVFAAVLRLAVRNGRAAARAKRRR